MDYDDARCRINGVAQANGRCGINQFDQIKKISVGEVVMVSLIQLRRNRQYVHSSVQSTDTELLGGFLC